MSGESPGYVPPDHTSTAEFAIARRRSAEPGPAPDDTPTGAPPADDPPPPSDTLPPSETPSDDDLPENALPSDDLPPQADTPVPVETITDLPAVDATVTDLPGTGTAAEDVDSIPEGVEIDDVSATLFDAPETLSDVPAPLSDGPALPSDAAAPPSDDPEPDFASVTVTDIPLPRREDPDAIPFGAPTPNDTAPSEPAEAPLGVGEWTADFGAEAAESADEPQPQAPPAEANMPAAAISPETAQPSATNPPNEAVVALGAEGIPPAPPAPSAPASPDPQATPVRPMPASSSSPASSGPHTGDLSVARGVGPSSSSGGFGLPPAPYAAPSAPSAPPGPGSPLGPGSASGPGSAPTAPGPGSGPVHAQGSGIGATTSPTALPTPGIVTHGNATPGPQGEKRRPWLLVALAVGVLLVLVGVAASFLLGGSSKKDDKTTAIAAAPSSGPAGTEAPTSAPPSGAPSAPPSGEPSGGGAPSQEPTGAPSQAPSGTPGAVPPAGGGTDPVPPVQPGTVTQGNGISYQIVQQSQGYFEGQFIVTNPGTAPLTGWKITFDTPRADVHAIWGAALVHGGTHVEIDGTVSIPPGGSLAVRFGATGLPARPQGCQLSGRPCGF